MWLESWRGRKPQYKPMIHMIYVYQFISLVKRPKNRKKKRKGKKEERREKGERKEKTSCFESLR